MTPFEPVDIKPVTGFMDTRSSPDEVPFGGYRYVLNFGVTTKHKLCRQTGFEKLLSKDQYNNADLHHHFGYVRQAPTFGMQAESPAGFSKLFIGTQNTLLALDNSIENWRVLTDLAGGPVDGICSERRFKGDYIGNVCVFTNGFDKPVSHVIDQPLEADGTAVALIGDLERLHVTKVGFVKQWNNLMFYFNLVRDGEHQSNVFMWSDYKSPLSVVPHADESLAGEFTLPSGSAILAAKELGSQLYVYTTKGIYALTAVGGTVVISVSKRYIPEKPGARTLAYPNTLVSNGQAHFYWGTDAIYYLDLVEPEPKIIEWIHRSSSIIFDDINSSRCAIHVGGFHADKKEIWWSWAKNGQDIPSATMILNTEFPFAGVMDHGFTMFVNYEPDRPRTIRDIIYDFCICTDAEFTQYYGNKNQGLYCFERPNKTCDITPLNFHSSVAKVVDDITVEDYTRTPDPDSLAGIFSGVSVEDFCGAEYSTDECNAEKVFVMASSLDLCLKQATNVYYREICTGFEGCGTYSKNGYRSKLQSGPLALGIPDQTKTLNYFSMYALAGVSSIPSQIKLTIGFSSEPYDPITASGNCAILWEEQDIRKLECQGVVDAARHQEEGTRPDGGYNWNIYREGFYLYYDIEIINDDVTPKDTGGAMCISQFRFSIAATEEINY